MMSLDYLNDISKFYNDVILQTDHVHQYCRWCLGKYPLEEDFIKYIKMNAMYGIKYEQSLIGCFALTLGQDDAYHKISWIYDCADEQEIAVLHILATHPMYQKQGLGKTLVSLAIDLAKQRGCHVLRLDALATNLPARHL